MVKHDSETTYTNPEVRFERSDILAAVGTWVRFGRLDLGSHGGCSRNRPAPLSRNFSTRMQEQEKGASSSPRKRGPITTGFAA